MQIQSAILKTAKVSSSEIEATKIVKVCGSVACKSLKVQANGAVASGATTNCGAKINLVQAKHGAKKKIKAVLSHNPPKNEWC